MLKKFLNTTVAVLTATAIITPGIIFADDLGDIGADQTDVHVEASDTVDNNSGEVSSNEGHIETNTSDGSVVENTGTIATNEGTVIDNGTDTLPGVIELNAGEVTINNGTIEENNGVVDPDTQAVTGGTVDTNNGTILENGENGSVKDNNGTVETNKGEVKNNTSEGTVEKNEGTVKKNDGAVEENSSTGTIEENNGSTIAVDTETNEVTGDGVVTNKGTIEDNNGKVLKNEAGSVIENNDGSVSANSGRVDENTSTGNITLNDGNSLAYDSETDSWIGDGVVFNAGTIANNEGDVAENVGMISLNSEDGVVSVNRGQIQENEGVVANNFGTVNNTTDGVVQNNYGDAEVTGGAVEKQWWEVWANSSNDTNGNPVSNYLKASIGGIVSKIVGTDDDGNDISVDYVLEESNSSIVITPDQGYAVVALVVGKDAEGNDICETPIFDSRNMTWTIKNITGNVSLLYETEAIAEKPEGWDSDVSSRKVSYVVSDEGIKGCGRNSDLAENATINGGVTISVGDSANHKNVLIEDPENPGTYIECPVHTYGEYTAKTNRWESSVDAVLPSVNGYAWKYDGVNIDNGALQFSLVKVERKTGFFPLRGESLGYEEPSDSNGSNNGNGAVVSNPAIPTINAGVSATGMIYTIPASAPTTTALGGTAFMTNEQKVAAAANLSQGSMLVTVGNDSEGVQTMIPSAEQMKDQQGSAVTLLGQNARVEYCVSFAQPFTTVGNTAWLREKHEVIMKVNGLRVGTTVYLMFTDAFGKVQLIPCVVGENGVVIGNLSNIGSGGILSIVSI